MAGVWSQILVHVVWGTRYRRKWIRSSVRQRLHAYLGGIVRGVGGTPLAIGGVEDHVHLQIALPSDLAIADVVRVVKAKSSKWAKRQSPELVRFQWQEGYGAFSVSKSQQHRVVQYILNQEEHHRRESYQSEVGRLARLHDVDLPEGFSLLLEHEGEGDGESLGQS